MSLLNNPLHLAELYFNFDDSLEYQINFVSGRDSVFEKKAAMCFSIKTKAPHFDQFYHIFFSKKREQWAIPEKIQTGRVEDILF